MRVGVVTQYFPTSAQPWAGHSAYQTVRLLAQRCTLRVFYPEGRYPALLKPKSRIYDALDPAWQPAGVPVEYIPYPTLPLVSRPLNGFTAAAALHRRVKQFAPDILLSYVVYPDGYAALRLGRRLHVPVVLTAIGSDLNRISDPLCGVLTRRTLRLAETTTTVSHDLLRTARRMGSPADTSVAILNGCDTGTFHPADRLEARRVLELDPAAEIVLYVGRLDVRKGLVELVEAAAALHARRPQMRCYIVGEGSDKPLLTAAVARLNAESFVTFVPSCTTERVAQWMAAADLVTLPSYKEGCPNVVIEALASGRPVVATNVGGIPELMDNNSGRLIPPREIPPLTEALDEVLSNSWDPEVLAHRHGRGWQAVADDLYAVLEGTLARKAHRR